MRLRVVFRESNCGRLGEGNGMRARWALTFRIVGWRRAMSEAVSRAVTRAGMSWCG